MSAGHVGRGPCFVDEHEPRRIKIELLVEPPLTELQDVWACLLYRVASLFLRV